MPVKICNHKSFSQIVDEAVKQLEEKKKNDR